MSLIEKIRKNNGLTDKQNQLLQDVTKEFKETVESIKNMSDDDITKLMSNSDDKQIVDNNGDSWDKFWEQFK